MKGSPILILSVAIVSEVLGTTFMKLSEGFTQPVFGIVTAVCYILSFVMLTFALKDLSLGMAYGIWGGVGTFLTTLIGIIFWSDPFSIVVGIGMIAVVAGIALLSKRSSPASKARRAPCLRGVQGVERLGPLTPFHVVSLQYWSRWLGEGVEWFGEHARDWPGCAEPFALR